MRLISLVLTVGLGVSAQSGMARDEPAGVKRFDAVDRSFSISKELGVSDKRKRLDQWLETAPPENIPLKKELARQYNILPPPYLFDLAERSFSADVRAALEWYWLGHIRARMDAVLCADASAVDAVAYLPARARTVTKYIRTNPNLAGEVGEKTLARTDLRDSQASPWWICSRGSDAQPNTDPLSWLVPQDEMSNRYAGLMAETKQMFDEMRRPMDDQIAALTPAIAPIVVATRRSITNVLWSRSRGLLMSEAMQRKAGRLLLWDGGRPLAIANDVGGSNLYVAGDFVSYRTRAPNGARRALDSGAPRTLRYKGGLLGQDLRQYSHSYSSARLSPGGFQRARADKLGFAPWSQNSLTCEWTNADQAEKASFDAVKTVELGSAALGQPHGFLESTSHGTFFYASRNAKPVQVSDKQFPLKCMKFIRFLNAIHMVACPISYVTFSGDPVNHDLMAVSLLKLGEDKPALEQRDLPPIPGERGETQTLITKTGIVRLMKSRYTPVQKRPGGLYWFGWPGDDPGDDEPKKIWEGYPDQADVSDDGCKIALSTIKSAASIGRDRSVLVLDICEATLKPAE